MSADVVIVRSLRTRRVEAGLSQRKLGKLAGVSQSRVSRLETGGVEGMARSRVVARVQAALLRVEELRART